MKSKKLFAILTIIAFMMTMLPMAAFGADLEYAYSTTKSTVSVSGSSVDDYFDISKPTENAAKFTLTFKDNRGELLASGDTVNFTIQTSSDLVAGWIDLNGNKKYDGGSEEITDENAYDMASNDGLLYEKVVLNGGKVVLYLSSYSAVSYTVKFFAGLDADAKQFGSTKTVNVEKEDEEILLEIYEDDDDDTPLDAVALADWEAGKGFELRAELASDEEDVEVTFKQKEAGGTYVVIGTADTDDEGVATLWVDGEKAADFVYKAEADGDKSNTVAITVKPADPYAISVVSTEGKKLAVDEEGYVEFKITDEYGNLIKSEDDVVQPEITEAPADSDMEDETFAAIGTNSSGIAKFYFTPDEVGNYTVKAEVIASDKKASVGVEAVEFDDVVSLTFTLKNMDGETVPALTRCYSPATADKNEENKEAGYLVVKGVSAAGAEVELDVEDLKFASSNTSHVSFSTSDVLEDNEKYLIVKKDAAGTYQITVHYADDNVVGVYDLKVVGGISALKATPAYNGKTATVSLQYVDKNGEATFDANRTDMSKDEQYTISAPAGLVITDIKKINDRGAASFVATASEYGTYTVTVLTNDKKIAATIPLTFEMPAAEKPVIGAKNVTMFIGATGYVQDGVAKVMDVAPFIKDGRTFVAVRYIAEAFGAEAGWNEATQTVTLSRPDMTITIVIGSNTITVVKDGVTSTVTADVAAFIQDGRTVLPLRAVAEAFGAQVEYNDVTQAVSFTQ